MNNIKDRIMKINMGNTDKIVRVAAAAIIAVLFLTGVVKGTLGIVLLIIAVVLAATSLTGFCPLYSLLRINTRKKV